MTPDSAAYLAIPVIQQAVPTPRPSCPSALLTLFCLSADSGPGSWELWVKWVLACQDFCRGHAISMPTQLLCHSTLASVVAKHLSCKQLTGAVVKTLIKVELAILRASNQAHIQHGQCRVLTPYWKTECRASYRLPIALELWQKTQRSLAFPGVFKSRQRMAQARRHARVEAASRRLATPSSGGVWMGKDFVALRMRIALIVFRGSLKLKENALISYHDMQRALDQEGRIGSLPPHMTQTCKLE